MKLIRMFSALALVALLAGVAYVSQANEPTGVRMSAAADRFLGTLSGEQREKATFAFDDKERLNWHFVPLQDAKKNPTRKGLRLLDMSEEQQEAAKALLRTGTSDLGYSKATAIMSLESILNELEGGKVVVRNPGWYFFTVFGTPTKTGKWGWRVEGHHLALNFVVDGGKLVSATPSFFGANPATVKDGARKGTRVLAEAEDLAIKLFKALDDDQKKIAHQSKQFPEVEGRSPSPKVGTPVGLPAEKMNETQQALLSKLIASYAERMPADVAEAELAKIKSDGLDKIYFAYAGDTEPGKPHTYRIQGASFVIEFLNIQADSANNPANHIHSAWRSIKGDFGLTN
jgi:hypothetical protein